MANRRGEHLRSKINDTINQLAEKEYGIGLLAREEQVLSRQNNKQLKENTLNNQRQERQLDAEKLRSSRQQLERALEAHQRSRAFQRERVRA